jgi:RNA 2',3'-cyclic 3'-phosphodiesterase
MRAFFAIEVSDDVKKYLTTVAMTAAKHLDGVKWVNEAGRHITLKFLGEIEEEMAGKLQEATAHIGAKYAPFTATVKGIDAFPDKRRTRVIVIALENGVDNISNIYKDIEESCLASGIEKETRPYTPHITLGRKKVPGPVPDKALVKLERMSFNVDSVVLFKSTLRPEGARYAPVWKIELKGGK